MKVEFRYGKKIQQLREERAWTQEQLATIAGVETRTIQRVEKGQTKSSETLKAIAAAFDLNVDALRTKWRVAESRLLRTWLVTTYREFVTVQEAHPWQMSYRSVRCIRDQQKSRHSLHQHGREFLTAKSGAKHDKKENCCDRRENYRESPPAGFGHSP